MHERYSTYGASRGCTGAIGGGDLCGCTGAIGGQRGYPGATGMHRGCRGHMGCTGAMGGYRGAIGACWGDTGLHRDYRGYRGYRGVQGLGEGIGEHTVAIGGAGGGVYVGAQGL